MLWRRFTPLLILTLLLSACGTAGGFGGDANVVDITIVYGSEKQAWLEDVTATFNEQRSTTPEGSVIRVEAIPMGSADSMNQVISGNIQATIWSPASSILVPVANDLWSRQNSGARLVEDSPPPLVLSPVVIAMWEPMARALGWPDTPIGWGDIAEFATNDETWADYGYPEWGNFQFGHTHPDYSNSGVTTMLALAYAANNKTRDLTVADVQQQTTADFIRNVESAVIHYGESTGFFGTQMFNRGPAYLSAAVLYENLVVESYDRERYPNLGTPVVAIYPKEGTFWSDHPYAVVDAPWVTDEMRAAAEVYRDFLLAGPQQQKALEYGFRPADPSIPVSTPITPEFGVDPNQPQTLLEVPNVAVYNAIREVWGTNKKRVDVMVVLDTSGSMQEEGRLENAKVALRSFVEQLSDEDGFGLTTFSDEATVLTPISPIGPKRSEVLTRIGGLFPRGNTRLVSTVIEAYNTLAAEPPGERIRAVVVLSDGADNQSAPNAVNDLLTILAGDEGGTSIKVFTIAYGTGTDVNLELLEQISNASGARTFESSPTDIEQIYREIATFF